MKVFYYLMAVDGNVCNEEIEKFEEIGKEIDPVSFEDYKNCIIEECEQQINSVIDEEDCYDVIQEGVDDALAYNFEDSTKGINVSLLVWNMLAIAFSNDEYSNIEKKLIKHVVRTMKIDNSVFIEMEQLIKTAISVANELTWIKSSNKTYAEASPIVAELENRQRVIVESAKALIEDKIFSDNLTPEAIKSNFLNDAKAKIEGNVVLIASEFDIQMKKLLNSKKSNKKNNEKTNTKEDEIEKDSNIQSDGSSKN